ncbi:MAG: energy-coupling factor transporter transmembrane protein EcfT [Gammaproteobacteria bacterium]|nr:energy-coupling factor transporter transmembrane protein EcfT [Gammaproteobacteria bacterium]
MHPVIRVSVFLIFAISIAHADTAQLIIAAAVLIVLYSFTPRIDWSRLFKFLLRLRWFYISIILLYGFLTPGQALLSSLPDLSIEGLLAGGLQVLCLMMMIFALLVLVSNQSKSQMLGALYWWLYPVKLIRLSREKLALRIMLTMQAVERLQDKIYDYQSKQESTNKFQRLVNVTTYAFNEVVHQAQSHKSETISLSCLETPPVWQWCVPFALIVMFVMSNTVVTYMAGMLA